MTIIHGIDGNIFTMQSGDLAHLRINLLFQLEKPRCKTTMRLQHFSQRIINDWNQLPENVIAAKDVNEFKTKLDRHWSHEVMYMY